MSALEKGNLPKILEKKYGEEGKLWFVSNLDSSLIVIPKSSKALFASMFAKQHKPNFGFTELKGPPDPAELDNFKCGGIIVLESNPGTGNPLTTRAVWETLNGEAALGGLFPSQRQHLTQYETLSGIIFPRSNKYQGPINGEVIDPWIKALSNNSTLLITNVLDSDEQLNSLEKVLHINRSNPVTVAIFGLGDIGSYVAQALYSQNKATSHINKLILASKSRNTVEALEIELEDIGLQRDAHPDLLSVTQENIEEIFAADVILFLASGPIPPATSTSMNIDVRAVQYASNVKILRELLENASKANWGGTLLVASDPVEQLTMAALQGSVSYNHNNQRIAGFGAAINYGRARRQAEEMGMDPNGVKIFGAHGKSVVAIPSLIEEFDANVAETLSLRTGMRNYEVRERLKKPWRAPAAWMYNALQNLILHNPTWASTFLPSTKVGDLGAFFGSQVTGDLNLLNTWQLENGDVPPNAEIIDVLAREHRYISITSFKPEMLFTDPFKGRSNPADSQHIAFHGGLEQEWLQTAKENASLINTSDLALSTRSQEITMEIEKAIMEGNLDIEKTAKQKLLKLIGASLHRSEANIINEKIDVVVEGNLGGELFSNIYYRQLSEVCKKIVDRIDIENLSNRTLAILNERREPEIDIVDQSKVKTDTLFEELKHPHIFERSQAWRKLSKLIQEGLYVSPTLAKKVLTLVNFGDDFTLYQISTSETNNAESMKSLYQAQRDILDIIAKKIKGYNEPEITDTIVFGTTGAPFGQHHIKAIRAGIETIKERYVESNTETFIALDDFSRSKAGEIVSGEVPSLALRRRIALLQTINEMQVHLVNPAIPIWFDVQNTQLLEQIRKEVSGNSKIWRLIGGDSLKNYPNNDQYRSIPHIVEVRGENRSLIDSLLNRMRFNEYLQVDINNNQSSTQIRMDLKNGIHTEEINSLSAAFIKHYGLFQ